MTDEEYEYPPGVPKDPDLRWAMSLRNQAIANRGKNATVGYEVLETLLDHYIEHYVCRLARQSRERKGEADEQG